MNELLNRLVSPRISFALMLSGMVLAILGCRSSRSNAGGSGTAQAPAHAAGLGSAGTLQAGAHQPLPYHIDADMRPVTTSSAVAQYDVAILRAIAARWYSLLDTAPDVTAKGKVVVEFELRPDGSVAEARIAKTTVDKPLALICQKAVLDPAPFAPWPEDMRQALTNEHRAAIFTFYFHGRD